MWSDPCRFFFFLKEFAAHGDTQRDRVNVLLAIIISVEIMSETLGQRRASSDSSSYIIKMRCLNS